MTQLQFDANTVAPNTGPSILPKGDYKAMITDSEIKPTNNGQGKYIQFSFQVIEGEHTNRKLTARLNIENPNQQAVEIARGDLSAICHATGQIQLQDTSQLHNIPMMITVTVRPAHGQYGESNEIRGYSVPDAGGQVAAPAAQPQAAQPVQPAAQPVVQPATQPAAQPQAAVQPTAQPAATAPGTPDWAG